VKISCFAKKPLRRLYKCNKINYLLLTQIFNFKRLKVHHLTKYWNFATDEDAIRLVFTPPHSLW